MSTRVIINERHLVFSVSLSLSSPKENFRSTKEKRETRRREDRGIIRWTSVQWFLHFYFPARVTISQLRYFNGICVRGYMRACVCARTRETQDASFVERTASYLHGHVQRHRIWRNASRKGFLHQVSFYWSLAGVWNVSDILNIKPEFLKALAKGGRHYSRRLKYALAIRG